MRILVLAVAACLHSIAAAQIVELCPIPIPLPHERCLGNVPSTFDDTCERYWIHGPSAVPPGGAPLVVLFHGAGMGNHNEMMNTLPCSNWGNYNFTSVATQNGWFVMMHDGGQFNGGTCVTQYPGCQTGPGGYWQTFGTEEFHLHTDAAIAHALSHYPIDPDRIYGYGFSMGGNEVMIYAARHLDPTNEGMFAAIVAHSTYGPAYSDLCASFANCIYSTPDDLCAIATTPAERFNWYRANTLAFDCSAMCPVTNPSDIDDWNSLALNIKDLPIKLMYHVNENRPDMEQFNEVLNLWLGGSALQHLTTSSGCGNYHRWSDANAQDVIQFLDGKTLQSAWNAVRFGGEVLCAEDGERYYHFSVVRSGPGFGRIAWDADSPASGNRLRLLEPTTPTGYVPDVSEVRIFAEPSDGFSVLDATVSPVNIHAYYDLTALEVTGFTQKPSKVAWTASMQGQALWLFLNNWTYTSGTVRINGAPKGRYRITL